jgi:hypothetical protein
LALLRRDFSKSLAVAKLRLALLQKRITPFPAIRP